MFGAILGGGLSLFGSILGARQQAAAAQAQMDASADQLQKNIMLAREARKGNIGKFIGQNIADYGYGGDLERAANIQDFRSMLGEQMSPLAIEQKQRARRGRIAEETAKRRATIEGMFGPISSSFG